MSVVGEALLRVRPDTGNFEGELHSKLGGAFRGVAAVAATAFAAIGAGALLKGSIEAASSLEESMSKVKVVFGDSAGAVQAFAADSAQGLGQSKQQALEATGTFGNLFTSMGVGRDKAADLSTGLVTMASDLASFNNVSPTEALDALRSGLVGETEPLRKFGINLNEATLKQKAMELGLGDGKTALTSAAKAQAAYALITEQSTNAQGDFARTSGGLANQMRILKAEFTNLQASAGAALAPALAALAPVITQVFTALQPLLTTLGGALAQVVSALAPVFTTLVPPLTQIIGLLAQILIPVGQLIAALAPIVALVLKLAAVFIEALMPAILPLIGTLTEVVNVIAKALEPVIAELIPIIQENAGVYVQLIQALLPLLPALAQILVALLPLLPPMLQMSTLGLRLIAVLAPLIEVVAKFAAFLIEKLAVAISAVVGFIRDDLIPWFRRIPEAIAEFFTSIPQKVGAILDFFRGLPGDITRAIGDLRRIMFDLGVDAMESLGRGLRSLIGKLGGIAGKIKDELVSTLNPANWFSTPEEHYRMLWGDAFRSIAEEGKKSLSGITATVNAVSSAATPTPGTGALATTGPAVVFQDGAIRMETVAQSDEATTRAVTTRIGLAAIR